MKKLTTTIAIALLAFTTVTATPFTGKEKKETVKADFASSSYLVKNTSTIKVFVEKTVNSTVNIKLRDLNGKILTNQTVWKAQTGGAFQFDLSNLPDNTYELVISNGSKTEVKQIKINTNTPTEVVREVTIK